MSHLTCDVNFFFFWLLCSPILKIKVKTYLNRKFGILSVGILEMPNVHIKPSKKFDIPMFKRSHGPSTQVIFWREGKHKIKHSIGVADYKVNYSVVRLRVQSLKMNDTCPVTWVKLHWYSSWLCLSIKFKVIMSFLSGSTCLALQVLLAKTDHITLPYKLVLYCEHAYHLKQPYLIQFSIGATSDFPWCIHWWFILISIFSALIIAVKRF